MQTCNNSWTVFACLQQAVKQFDLVLVIDDGSTDGTLLEVDRFIRRERPRNVHVFDLSWFDPMPSLVAPKREGMEPTSKTQSKAKFKAHALAKQVAPSAVWTSIEADVILHDDARARIVDRVSRWDEPESDCEFFNLVMSIDQWNVRAVTASEERYVKLPGIRHRKPYDHPGDWGLATSWLGGQLVPGPDPVFPYGPTFLPWKEKNQLGKKGQDDSPPFGFHMLSYRESDSAASYSGRLCYAVESIAPTDPDVDWGLLHRLRFPVIARLDDKGQRRIISCE